MLILQSAFVNPGLGPRLSNHSGFSSDPSSPYSSTVTFTFNSDGTLDRTTNTGTITPSGMEWWSAGSDPGRGASYDVRCKEIISGTAFSSEAAAVGTYIQMNINRAWTLTRTTVGGREIIATFQIVATGDTVVLAESMFTFSIENGLL